MTSLDTAALDFKEKLRRDAKAKKASPIVKRPAKPIQTKGVFANEALFEMIEELRSIKHLLASDKSGDAAPVTFDVTERDAQGNIKSFTVRRV